MIANLVRKDFLLIKKHLLAFIGMALFAPVLLVLVMNNSGEIRGFGAIVFFLYGNFSGVILHDGY